MRNDIKPFNNKYQKNGYWERYYGNGNIHYKGTYINDKIIGYWEHYSFYGKLVFKGYRIL